MAREFFRFVGVRTVTVLEALVTVRPAAVFRAAVRAELFLDVFVDVFLVAFFADREVPAAFFLPVFRPSLLDTFFETKLRSSSRRAVSCAARCPALEWWVDVEDSAGARDRWGRRSEPNTSDVV